MAAAAPGQGADVDGDDDAYDHEEPQEEEEPLSPRRSLVRAAAGDDVARLGELLAGKSSDAASLSAAGYAAAEAGALAALRALAAAGLDLTAPVSRLPEPDPWTRALRQEPPAPPIRLAAGRGHAAAVRELVELGARLDGYTDPSGRPEPSPLHAAAAGGYADLVRLLLDLGADIEAKDEWSRSPLLVAAGGGHRDLNAAPACHPDAFLTLAERGADLRATDYAGQGVLRCPAILSHERIIRFLESKGLPAARSAAKGPWGKDSPPLVRAAERGDTASVEFLLGAGASADASDRGECRTALFAAAAGAHAGAARLLAEAGARLDAPSRALVPPARAEPYLWEAVLDAEEGDPADPRAPFRASPDHEEPREASVAARAVEAAAGAGSVEIVGLLLDRGCDAADLKARRPIPAPSPAPISGRPRPLTASLQGRLAQFSALQFAAMGGHAPVVRLLLGRCPSPPEARRGPYASPLEIAAAGGHAEALALLLERCAAPPAGLLDVCLALAARAGSPDCARLLLERGARPSARIVDAADRGKERGVGGPATALLITTPLLAACARGHYECAALLLERGADAREAAARREGPGGLAPLPAALEGLGLAEDGREEAGRSALELAAAAGSARLPKPKRQAPPPPRCAHSSALGLAVARGHAAAARALLALGADPANPLALAWRDPSRGFYGPGPVKGRSALQAAVQRRDLPLLVALLERLGPDGGEAKRAAVCLTGDDGQSCLYQVLAGEDGRRSGAGKGGAAFAAEAPRLLLAAGADPFRVENAPERGEARGRRPESCLARAAAAGPAGTALLRRALPFLPFSLAAPRTPDSTAALAAAVSARSLEFVRLALELGVCPSFALLGEEAMRGRGAETPPLLAAAMCLRRGNRGADAEAPDEQQAADALEMARLLLEAGAPPDEAAPEQESGWGRRSDEPRTPLQAALESPLGLPLAELLMARGAPLDAAALRYAVRSRFEPLARAVFARASPETMAEFVRGAPKAAAELVKGIRMEDPSPLPVLQVLRELAGDGVLGHGQVLLQVAQDSTPNRGSGMEFMNTRDVIHWLLAWEVEACEKRGGGPPPLETEGQRSDREAAILWSVAAIVQDAQSASSVPFLRMALDLALNEGAHADRALAERFRQFDATSPGYGLYGEAGALRAVERRVEAARAEGGDPDPADEALAVRELRPSYRACRLGLRLTAARLARAAAPSRVDEPDAEGRTALYYAVEWGPPMLAACIALIRKGADAGRAVGEGPTRRTVLQGHSDVKFLAALKRASGLRDVYICREEEGEGAAAFAARLRVGLETAHVTCLEPEEEGGAGGGEPGAASGSASDPSAAEHLRRVAAVIFAVSPAACASARCRAELAAARSLGRTVLPVWREKAELDDQMQGFLLKQQFADFTSGALLEAGLPAFALTVGAGGGAAPAAAPSAAAELAALPEARCDAAGEADFLFLWCSPADAGAAVRVARALARRGLRCWTECPGVGEASGGQDAGAADVGALAAVRCRAFVPLLSPSSIGDPLLRDRIQLAELNKRPILPLLPTDIPAPEGVPPDAEPFAYVTAGNVALFANLDRLVDSVPGLAPTPPPRPRPAAPAAVAPAPAEQPAPAAAPETPRAPGAGAAAAATEARELEERRRRVAEARAPRLPRSLAIALTRPDQLEARVREAEAAGKGAAPPRRPGTGRGPGPRRALRGPRAARALHIYISSASVAGRQRAIASSLRSSA
eukprot:tig00021571_g22379.t1